MAGIFDAPTQPVREQLFIVHENDPFITGRDPLDLPTDYLQSLEFVKLRERGGELDRIGGRCYYV